MNESKLLDLIYKRSEGLGLSGARLLVGPGDDAAVIETPGGDVLLLTVDQLIESRHYEAGTDLELVARKAIARSVSDIAAMGGFPSWSMATGILPTGFAHGDQLFEAMSKYALSWGCPLIGGDIASSDGPLSLTVTVCGRLEPGASPKLRSGAQAGDELWVTGALGGSLASGHHLRFEPKLETGRRAAKCESVRAMMDISDGLGRDAGRLARSSGVLIEIDADMIPLNKGVASWNEAASEGEDYELLIIGADLSEQIPGLIGPIGRCVASDTPGVVIIDEGGTRHDASGLGWDH
ncbi:MAG: thiamine-monophosphate kinase [Phycisphaera sp.]|nr:MAG: thiamine-monophosphate kinase [Phycisphaera sp.]